jgi:hypothetical protein
MTDSMGVVLSRNGAGAGSRAEAKVGIETGTVLIGAYAVVKNLPGGPEDGTDRGGGTKGAKMCSEGKWWYWVSRVFLRTVVTRGKVSLVMMI